MTTATSEHMEAIARLDKDLKAAARTMTSDEARFLVDAYYMMQRNRIRSDNQVRALTETGEPNSVLAWCGAQFDILERDVKRCLDAYSDGQALGQWARSIIGVGPVIAAGFLAHIDLSKCPTAGNLWRFAGLDPSCQWEKGQKRPFNGALKTLCWKLGESFVKVSGNDKDVYGKVYLHRKEREHAKNDAGEYADQAVAKLERFKIGKTTDAYKAYSEGRLPDGHIHARAKRYAVKLFLSHYHAVGHWLLFGTMAPRPYAFEYLKEQHAHLIAPPETDTIDGFDSAWAAMGGE